LDVVLPQLFRRNLLALGVLQCRKGGSSEFKILNLLHGWISQIDRLAPEHHGRWLDRRVHFPEGSNDQDVILAGFDMEPSQQRARRQTQPEV
jgi:hypothetical protein